MHSTTSYWLDRPRSSVPTAADVLTGVDVLVVGGGMAGLCTAARMHEAGIGVALVDAGPIASRTTGHTTAKITSLHGTIYQRLSAGRGRRAAEGYATTNRTAVVDLIDLIERWAIDCSLTRATAYTCAVTADGAGEVHAEAAAATVAGLPVRLTTDTDLPMAVTAAVALDGEAHFDPVRFADGVLDRLRVDGVDVVEGLRITGVDEHADDCVVHTERGDTFTVGRVVQTTHLPISDPALLSGRVRPVRSYVVAGSAPQVPAGMYLAADAGWSVRPAGDDPTICLVGGEGHPMIDHVSSAREYERLTAFARDAFGIEDITHRWSAFDYEPVDGVPFIGRLSPGSQRRYVATGFSKWGMSNGMVAATLITDAVLGRQHPHAGVFDAARLASNIGRDVVRNNAHVGVRFIKDRISASPESDEPRPGTGLIVRRGLKPVAVSCDDNGVVRRVSAVCPHLGCVVGFNDGDQTWDCPCHGSRFDLDGTVLDGPSTKPLAPVDDDRDPA